MLTLTRRVGETLVIGKNIRVVVLEVHGNQVRIGVDAPEDIKVLREELLLGDKVTKLKRPRKD